MASQRVPNITATSAEVGGTVDSHSRPVTAPKTSVVGRGRRQRDEDDDRERAGEIDDRQDVALGHAVAEIAGRERADDVEQADGRKRPAADLARKVRGRRR